MDPLVTANGREFAPALHAELLDAVSWSAPEQFRTYRDADAQLRPWIARADYLEQHPEARLMEGSEPYEQMLDELQREQGDDEFLMNFSGDLGEGRVGRFHRFGQFIAPAHRAEAERLSRLLATDKEYGKDWTKLVCEFVKKSERRVANGGYRDVSPESQLERTRRAMGGRNQRRTLLSGR